MPRWVPKVITSLSVDLVLNLSPDQYGLNWGLIKSVQEGLTEWHTTRNFDANIDVYQFPAKFASDIPDNVGWLRCTYSSIPACYLWHAVKLVLTYKIPPKEYDDVVRDFCLSTLRYIASAIKLLGKRRSPQVFGQCMAYESFNFSILILEALRRIFEHTARVGESDDDAIRS
jgi:hypothetical protein